MSLEVFVLPSSLPIYKSTCDPIYAMPYEYAMENARLEKQIDEWKWDGYKLTAADVTWDKSFIDVFDVDKCAVFLDEQWLAINYFGMSY